MTSVYPESQEKSLGINTVSEDCLQMDSLHSLGKDQKVMDFTHGAMASDTGTYILSLLMYGFV